MYARHLRFGLAMVVLAAACAKTPPTPSDDDPNAPGLTFSKVPAAIIMGRLFQIRARLNDAGGQMITSDSQTFVSIRAAGHGTLRGTLTRRAIGGEAIFDDLSYDQWEPITLTISADNYGTVTTRQPLPVRPVMRFVSMPPAHVPAGTGIGPLTIELVDGRGQEVRADQPVTLEDTTGLTVEGGSTRNFAMGAVTYPQVTLAAPGSRTLVWQSPGLRDLAAGITVHDGQETELIWLPAGRVGVPYRAELPAGGSDYRLLNESLPSGLTLEPTGELHGTPTEAGHAHLEIFALRGTSSVLWKAHLPVFSDSEAAPGTLDGQDVDGPYALGSFDETVTVESRHADVKVRLFHPMVPPPAGAGWPVIVFHHGAAMVDASHPTLFDRYDALLRRWASHGFVVATIDAPDLVWMNGRLVDSSLWNLTAMSENQRAVIAQLRVRNGDGSFPLAGRLDMDRVIAAGHSRGGGASLITARTEPSVIGGLLLEPLDPMTTVGGADVWNQPLPPKPFLMVIAGADADVPYPMVDYLYERRAGPMVAPTVRGALHFFACDDTCPPDGGRSASITRAQAQSITNAYAVPFLKYVANDEMTWAPLLFGHEGASSKLSPEGVYLRADRGAAALMVDDFQDEAAGRNNLGLLSVETQMAWSADEPSLLSGIRQLPEGYDAVRLIYDRPEALVRSNAHRLEWTQDGATYATALGTMDVRRRAAFVFRARSEGDAIPGARVGVRFTDHAGNSITLPGDTLVGDTGIGERFTDVIVPMRSLREAGLDLLELEQVQLVLQGTGAILIDDLRFE